MGKEKSSARATLRAPRSAVPAQSSAASHPLPTALASITGFWDDIVQRVAQLASGPLAACFQGRQLLNVCDSIIGLADNATTRADHPDAASATEQLQQLSVIFRQLQLPQLLLKLLRARSDASGWLQLGYRALVGKVLLATALLIKAVPKPDGGSLSGQSAAGQVARLFVTPEVLAEAAAAQKELALLLQELQQQDQQQEHAFDLRGLRGLSRWLLIWWQDAHMLYEADTAGDGAESLCMSLQPAAALTVQMAQSMLGSSNSVEEYQTVLGAADMLLQHVDDYCQGQQPSTGAASTGAQLLQHPACLHLELMHLTIRLHKLQCLAAATAAEPSCDSPSGSQGIRHSTSSGSPYSPSSSSPSSNSRSYDTRPGGRSSSRTSSGASSQSAPAAVVPEPSLPDLTLQLWQALGMSPAALPCFSAALGSSHSSSEPVQQPRPPGSAAASQPEAALHAPKCSDAEAVCAFTSATKCMCRMMTFLSGGNGTEPGPKSWEQLPVQHQQLLRLVGWLMPPLLLGAALQYCHGDARLVDVATLGATGFLQYLGMVPLQAAAPATTVPVVPATVAAAAGGDADRSEGILLSATLHWALLLAKQEMSGSGRLAAFTSKGFDTTSNSCSSSTTTTGNSSSALAALDGCALDCDFATAAVPLLTVLWRALHCWAAFHKAGRAFSAAVWDSKADEIMALVELLMRIIGCCKFICEGGCGSKQTQQHQQKPPPQQELQQQRQAQIDNQVGGAACKPIRQLYILMKALCRSSLQAHAIMLTTGPCRPVQGAGWLQQQRQLFTMAITYIKFCRTTEAGNAHPPAANLNWVISAAAEVIRALSKSSTWRRSSMEQRQAALAPWAILYGLILIELGQSRVSAAREAAQVAAAQLQHSNICCSSSSNSSSNSNAYHNPPLHGGCGGAADHGSRQQGILDILDKMHDDFVFVADTAEALQGSFCRAWSLDGDDVGLIAGQETLQRQQQQQQFQQQQQPEQEKAAIPIATALSAAMWHMEELVQVARKAAAVVHAALTAGRPASNTGSHSLLDCSSGAAAGSRSSSSSSGHGSSGHDHSSTAVNDAISAAAAPPARSLHEALTVVVLSPALSQLPQLLRAAGEVLCASFPMPWLCNNPDCSNLACTSERLLVGGKGCKCSGCRVARYCGGACQRAHWKQHKPVCKRLAAEAAAAAAETAKAAGSVTT